MLFSYRLLLLSALLATGACTSGGGSSGSASQDSLGGQDTHDASGTWDTATWDSARGGDVPHEPDAGPDAGPDAEPDAGPDAENAPPFPEVLEDDLLAILDAHLETIAAPGVTLTVVLPGKETLEAARGKARDEPLTSSAVGDRFRTGSVTKTYVAAASLQLVEEGVVGLDDPVDIWVPGYALGAGVTVRRLMNHTSGIPNYTDDPNFVTKVFGHGDPHDVISFALEMGLLFSPGDGYGYSNTNYYFLGLMLEAATGAPLQDVLRERLLDPYDLADTFLEGSETIEGDYVEGYIAGAPAPLTDMSWAWAAGAMVASGSDVCAWFDALYRGEVVNATHQQLMTERITLFPGGPVIDYGLGTQIILRSGLDLVGHTGATVGGQCTVYIDPASGVCAALMTNDFFATPESANDALWARLAKHLDGANP